MKSLLISSGEPAGIGPDVCLGLVNDPRPLVILGDPDVLAERAKMLGLSVAFNVSEVHDEEVIPNTLRIHPVACQSAVVPGVLNIAHASYVWEMLNLAVQLPLEGRYCAIVTAPVHKAILNEAGFAFTGHTEFFADYCQVSNVVMMLVCQHMRVALVTTHLPLREVPDAITPQLLRNVLKILHTALAQDFGVAHPRIAVAGLNPHAGESGYLGLEEIEVISPVLEDLRAIGMDLEGPCSADTLFHQQNNYDAFLAMYHDQGLPVLKYAGFGQAVNVTLGLPIIRTSVDHGTALSLAGTGKADDGSLRMAVDIAEYMVKHRASQACQ